MTTLDDFFRTPADTPPHPRLRDWKRRLSQPDVKAELELFRPGTALGLSQTEITLHFTENAKPQPVETMAWDDDLNAGLDKGMKKIPFDKWRTEDRRRAQAAISDLMDTMRSAARKEGIPEAKVGELLAKIASLAPDPNALTTHRNP